MAIEVRKFDSPLGAEIIGVDCAGDLSDALIGEIEEAWYDNLLVVFRGQELDDDHLMAFTRRFGELDMAPPNPTGRPWLPETPEINVVTNIRAGGELTGNAGNSEMTWHSDLGYIEVPPSASLLYCITCPAVGGDTYFANMYLAYEALPAETRDTIKGLKAIHDISTNASGVLRAGYAKVTDPRETPGCRHPLVRLHPKTGRKTLFLPRRLNGYVLGLEPADSEALLDMLWAHAARGEFTFGHKWRQGDLVMWDNRCTIHRRDGFDDSDTRLMHRTQVKGTEPPIPA